jgi:hypothetical protein
LGGTQQTRFELDASAASIAIKYPVMHPRLRCCVAGGVQRVIGPPGATASRVAYPRKRCLSSMSFRVTPLECCCVSCGYQLALRPPPGNISAHGRKILGNIGVAPSLKRSGYKIVFASENRIGRIRRAVKRAFIVSDGEPITVRDVLVRLSAIAPLR